MLRLPLGNPMHITVQYKWAQLRTVKMNPQRMAFFHTFSAAIEEKKNKKKTFSKCYQQVLAGARHLKNREKTTVEVILSHKL